MIKAAIVGNIASGKSAVQKILFSRGFSILDTDEVTHRLLNEYGEVKNTFKDYDVFDSEGKISREKLAKLVFSNPDLKKELEKILHPVIRKKIEEFFAGCNGDKIAFAAVPLLFEAGMEDLFDKIIFIYADNKIRLERLIKRNNYSAQYAQVRLNSQISQDEKIKKADYVIYNNSSLTDLKDNVLAVTEQLLKD